MDKTIEKKIAKIVKSELDSKNYEDTAWLKAFREAGGDDKQARASYVEIRTADLNDEYYEENNRLEEEKFRKEEERNNREDRILRAREIREQRHYQKQDKKNNNYSSIRSTTRRRFYTNQDGFINGKVKPFWRGEYSLVFSFWIILVIAQSVISLPMISIGIVGVTEDVTGFLALLFILYAIFLFIFNIFVMVGNWRSAGNYIIENKGAPWGFIVRIIIILQALNTFYQVLKTLNGLFDGS
jgi:uncharacterized membrane protein YhaH (DUF805 family)